MANTPPKSKATPKTAAAPKPAAKKAVPKKPAAKATAPKAPVAKKPAAKKAAAKHSAPPPPKPAKASAAAKPKAKAAATAARPTASNKASVTRTPAKSAPPKAVAEPKPAELKTDTVLEQAHPQDEVSFGRLIDWTIDRDTTVIKKYVDNMRERYPNLGKDDLAKKIISRRALKSGMVGALTSAGGLPSLPFSVPASVVITWRIQVFTIMAIAHVYGHLDKTENIRTDIYMILAGDAAKEALKRMGVQVSKDVTHHSVRALLSKGALTRINRLLGKRVLSATGKKSLVRLIPLVGAAVGFAFDWSAAHAFGKYAVQYYSEK